MAHPAYPAARIVAARAHLNFADQHGADRNRGRSDLAPLPDEEAMEAIIDASFWASLRREEGYRPKISLAFLPPEQAGLPIVFEQRLPLAPEALTHVAPAVERPGIHLGVWRESDKYYVWGATRSLPPLCFVLEVIDPGLLVVKRRRGMESGKFVNVAVLEGDQIKVLDHRLVNPADAPAMVASLLGSDALRFTADYTNILIQLAISMRAHGRGGSLLVVPHGTEAWRESIIGPTRYAVMPPYSELADLIRDNPEEGRTRPWKEALRGAVEVVGGLTAVDGAMVLSDQCDLLAFGAKIGRREGRSRVETVVDNEPIEGAMPRTVHPSALGGTRHLSAAQFGHDQQDAIALVASQDGRFTVFAWSPQHQAVNAHRVEALLL
jgi:hypothetical protein